MLDGRAGDPRPARDRVASRCRDHRTPQQILWDPRSRRSPPAPDGTTVRRGTPRSAHRSHTRPASPCRHAHRICAQYIIAHRWPPSSLRARLRAAVPRSRAPCKVLHAASSAAAHSPARSPCTRTIGPRWLALSHPHTLPKASEGLTRPATWQPGSVPTPAPDAPPTRHASRRAAPPSMPQARRPCRPLVEGLGLPRGADGVDRRAGMVPPWRRPGHVARAGALVERMLRRGEVEQAHEGRDCVLRRQTRGAPGWRGRRTGW